MFQVKDYHEKKYEGGEEEKTTTTDRVEVAKDGLGLILERWVCLFILIVLKAIKLSTNQYLLDLYFLGCAVDLPKYIRLHNIESKLDDLKHMETSILGPEQTVTR